jgi:hypothetical protein
MAMKNPTTYRYFPLTATSCIRILDIDYQTQEHQELSVHLREINLDHQTTSESYYDTLSYTWDEPPPEGSSILQDKIPIAIADSGHVEITSNLRAFLIYLAMNVHPQESKHSVWADQICINQRDIKERESQVAMMARIYQQSRSTLIWIGSPIQPISDIFTDLIQRFQVPPWDVQKPLNNEMFRDLQARLRCVFDSSMTNSTIGGHNQDTNCVPYTQAQYISSFEAILGRKWFTRAWIIQECTLSKYPLVIHNKVSFPFALLDHLLVICTAVETTDTMLSISKLLRTRGAQTLRHVQNIKLRYLPFHTSSTSVDEHVQGPQLGELSTSQVTLTATTTTNTSTTTTSSTRGPLTFLTVLSTLSFAMTATDPRDLVYAFLSFYRPTRMEMQPDYILNVANAYTWATAILIYDSQNLAILGLVRGCLDAYAGQDAMQRPMPSWAVDWRVNISAQGRRIDGETGHTRVPFDAAQGRKWFGNRPTSVGRFLHANGAVVAIIEHTGKISHDSRGSPVEILRIGEVVSDLEDYYRSIQVNVGNEKDLRNKVLQTMCFIGEQDEELDIDRVMEFYDLSERHVQAATTANSSGSAESKMLKRLITRATHMVFRKRIAVCSRVVKSDQVVDDENESDYDYDYTIAEPRYEYSKNKSPILCLAPKDTRVGDVIAILHGSPVPVVLRKYEKLSGNVYEVIGQSYVEGIMYGEAVSWPESLSDEFELT